MSSQLIHPRITDHYPIFVLGIVWGLIPLLIGDLYYLGEPMPLKSAHNSKEELSLSGSLLDIYRFDGRYIFKVSSAKASL